MKSVRLLVALISILTVLPACGVDQAGETVGEPSQAVQLGEVSPLFLLSASFARQLEAFDLEFGDFALAPDFFGLPYQNTQIEILQDDLQLITAFELQLPAEMSYDDLLELLGAEIDNSQLQSAVFGADSFYFAKGGNSVNILPFGNNVLAFQFAKPDFERVRDFIASLLIFR
ncbi:MAG: hypothetical protein K9L85_03800 [Candidatus Peribacteraceae bacterium]|nr:hypothetical protein [Candidatus Peribacteraceae bacterium]